MNAHTKVRFDSDRQLYLVDGIPFVIEKSWPIDFDKVNYQIRRPYQTGIEAYRFIAKLIAEKRAFTEADIFVFEGMARGDFDVIDLYRKTFMWGKLAPVTRNRAFTITQKNDIFYVDNTPIEISNVYELNIDAFYNKRIETEDGVEIKVYMDGTTHAKFYQLSTGAGFERFYGFITQDGKQYVIVDVESNKIYIGKEAKKQSRLECSVCKVQKEEANLCNDCRVAVYCGVECQRIDWFQQGHSEKCGKK